MNQADVQGQAFDTVALMTRLQDEHRALEAQLRGLTRGAHLTPAEAEEVRRLKRLKLSKKDQLQVLALQQQRP